MPPFTGAPFVAVGALTPTFVPKALVNAVNRVVTVTDDPAFNNPKFAHVIVPAPRFVAVAGGVCDKIAN